MIGTWGSLSYEGVGRAELSGTSAFLTGRVFLTRWGARRVTSLRAKSEKKLRFPLNTMPSHWG